MRHRRPSPSRGIVAPNSNGSDFTERFSLVVAAIAALPVPSCLIDGEVIVSDDNGLAVFELIRSWRATRLIHWRAAAADRHSRDDGPGGWYYGEENKGLIHAR